MIRPNFIGAPALYFNPSSDKLSTANFAAIDATYTTDSISPYAYTATVAENYDAFNFKTDDAGSVLTAASRVAFGLFLTPDNEKKNLMFQLSGRVQLESLAGGRTGGFFFFGRKATNNTVVSDKTGVQNTLAKWVSLPAQNFLVGPNNAASNQLSESIQTELFSLELASAYVYCFGYAIDNYHTSNSTIRGSVDLAFRKYNSELGVFRPSR